MAAAQTTNVLVTGANRGIGLILVQSYLARPNHTVIATVRSAKTDTTALTSLPKGANSRLVVVVADASSFSGYAQTLADAKSQAPDLAHLDIAIANAGITGGPAFADAVDPAELHSILATNVVGPLLLFQATRDLLLASPAGNPRFIVLSSIAGSIAGPDAKQLAGLNADKPPVLPITAYGISKAAVNYAVRSIHLQNESITAIPLHPGWLQTDMGNAGAAVFGMEKAPMAAEEGVKGVVKVIDEATREKSSGKFLSFDGSEIPW